MTTTLYFSNLISLGIASCSNYTAAFDQDLWHDTEMRLGYSIYDTYAYCAWNGYWRNWLAYSANR